MNLESIAPRKPPVRMNPQGRPVLWCIEERMTRALTYLLALTALLVQLGTGALPTDELCVSFGGSKSAECGCCGKMGHNQALKACCRNEGCEKCVRVPAPERQVAPQAKARTARVADVVGSTIAIPVVIWQAESSAPAWRLDVRTNESPPQLARLRTTRLML